MLKLLSAFSAILLSLNVAAAEPEKSMVASVDPEVEKLITAKLLATFKEAPQMVMPAPLPGYTQAVTSQGDFFISNDGKYMIYGRLFSLEDGLLEITNNALNNFRATKLTDVAAESIRFPAKGEEKYKVYVFTDVDCGFCVKLHRKIDQYQELGISVKYLAWPRSEKSFEKMRHIWCAEDRVSALNDAKLHAEITEAECPEDFTTVKEQWLLGREFGVTGTPAIVAENGTMISGFRDPEELLKTLQKVM